MTDEEIESITLYLLLNQVDEVAEADAAVDLSGEELFQQNCAKCHSGVRLGWDSGEGHPAPPLNRVFERHGEETILNIMRYGVGMPTGAIMPPWQEGYMYPDARYTDEALQRIIDYLREQQDPDVELPEEADDEDDEDDGDQLEAQAFGAGG
jgi:mono/diheme cytochrome c family protein